LGALRTGKNGAGNEVRTRDLNLGKVALYQLSYSRVIVTDGTDLQRHFVIKSTMKSSILWRQLFLPQRFGKHAQSKVALVAGFA
jgi:hypothetical protein